MRGKKELFFLIVGVVLFVFDLVTDSLVAVKFWSTGDYKWFALSLALIIFPLWIVNVCAVSCYQNRGLTDCCFRKCGDNCLIFSCWPLLRRHAQEFKQWKEAYWDNSPCEDNCNECNCQDCEQYREGISDCNNSAYEFAWLRFIETLTESTPQWIFQVYIMLSGWDFPWLTVLSAVVSLFSLAWSTTTLEKARVTKEGHNFTKKATGLYFCFQLLVLGPRLFVIAIYAYAFKGQVFVVLFGLWVLGSALLACLTYGYLMFTMTFAVERCCDPSLGSVAKILEKFVLSLALTLFVSETVLQSLGFESLVMHGLFFLAKSVENGFLVYRVVFQSDAEHVNVLEPIAWSLVGIGFIFGVISFVVRYVLKRREEAVNNESLTEVQENAFHLPGSGVISQPTE
ncbi:XK-related 4-like [Paramuricea clavata]|uniref:XK-related protein n=1 Tax=Paramuricea clavata TaxID=317549 RepID=A0A6S7IS30_PARCT|nr:XK-related 4-like [Paramuricea clavata]